MFVALFLCLHGFGQVGFGPPFLLGSIGAFNGLVCRFSFRLLFEWLAEGGRPSLFYLFSFSFVRVSWASFE